MSTQTLIGAGTLPVVNLLPPEIGEQRRLRRLQTLLGVGVLACVGVVAVLFVAAASDVSNAEDDLAATRAEGVSLQAQTAKYADIPAAIARVDAAKLQRSQAMAPEIRWSSYLNDLSLSIPAKVWLTSVTAAQSATDGAAATPVVGATDVYPKPGIGTVTFEGKAYGHDDVATWLQALSHEPGWIQAYFTNSTEDVNLLGPGGEPAVTFTSQVTVTEDALSRRFDQTTGN